MTVVICPSNIDTSKPFWNTFGHSETETSALWIVRFCQEVNGDSWKPFTLQALDGYYQDGRLAQIQAGWDKLQDGHSYNLGGPRPKECHESFCFNRLDNPGWLHVIGGKNGKARITYRTLIRVTPAFILTCLKANPKEMTFPGLGV